jgi:hypothetical protein
MKIEDLVDYGGSCGIGLDGVDSHSAHTVDRRVAVPLVVPEVFFRILSGWRYIPAFRGPGLSRRF